MFDRLKDLVDDVLLSKEHEVVDVDKYKTVPVGFHVDVGLCCAAFKSKLFEDFGKVILQRYWTAALSVDCFVDFPNDLVGWVVLGS